MISEEKAAEIASAADALSAVGEKVTLAAVRDAIGGGSFSTISEGVKIWREGKAEEIEMVEELPDEISDAAADAAVQIWQKATAIAEAKFDDLRAALTKAKEVAEEDAADAISTADAADASAQQALKAMNEKEAQRVEACRRADAAEQRMADAEARATASRDREIDAERRAARAEARLAAYEEMMMTNKKNEGKA